MASTTRDNAGVYTITVPNIYVCESNIKEPTHLSGPPPGTSTTYLHSPDPETTTRMGCPRPNVNLYINVFIFLLITTLIALCEYGYIPHTKNGFYCGDPKLSFPFNNDTCSMEFLLAFIIFVPAVTFWILEAILYQPDGYALKKTRFQESGKLMLLWYGAYILGSLLNITIVEIGKCVMGEHRPHFFDSCSPTTAINCTTGQYVNDYTCMNVNGYSSWAVVDASKSFPSGHTSLSVHLAIFIFWYLQQRMRLLGKVEPMLVTILLQCVILAFAIFASLSRITDSRHHWWDVLTGFFLGIATALYSIKILAKNFQMTNPSLSRDSISNSDISGDRSAAHPSVRRLLSTPPSYVKEVSIE